MIDHLVLFTARDDASPGEIEDLLATFRRLKGSIPGIVDLTIGENFSERSAGYTHGLFARFHAREDLRSYLEHPEHLSAVERLEDLTTGGRLVVDYEYDA